MLLSATEVTGMNIDIKIDDLDRFQKNLLILVSLAYLAATPTVWFSSPDSGIYVGTAEKMLSEGRYWFNGHPNLIYYPGYSTILAALIAVFGTNFFVLHLSSSLLTVSALWLSRNYFSVQRYGWAGFFVPLLLAANPIVIDQIFKVKSDSLFLCLLLATMLLWRRFAETKSERYFYLAASLVAFATLVRFEGLLIWGALVTASAVMLVIGMRLRLYRGIILKLNARLRQN